MNEGGQSSTGQLIDFMVTTHPAYAKLQEKVKETGKNMFEILGDTLEDLRREKGAVTTSKRILLRYDWHAWRERLLL